MGYNTTVVVMNDCLSDIEDDPDFGRKLAAAVSKVSCYGKPVDVSARGSVNAATVIESHHADNHCAVIVGGNYGHKVENAWSHFHYDGDNSAERHEMDILKRLAEKHGYVLHKKPKAKTPKSRG